MRGLTVTIIVLVSIALMLMSTSAARNFDDLPKNPDYIIELIDCVLERGICDNYGRKVKALIPEALNNNCHGCNPDQKQKFQLMSAFMKMVYPVQWKQIQEKYRANNFIHSDY